MMLANKLQEPVHSMVRMSDRQYLKLSWHVQSRPPDNGSDELITVALVRLPNTDCQVCFADRIIATRLGKALALDNRVGNPKPIVYSIKCEPTLNATLLVSEGVTGSGDFQ